MGLMHGGMTLTKGGKMKIGCTKGRKKRGDRSTFLSADKIRGESSR